MGARERLGPIVYEPRQKVRITYAPGIDAIDFPRTLVWDEDTKYYVPIVGKISPDAGEVLDHFTGCDPSGNSYNVFARQFDTKLFMLDDDTVANSLLEPGKGNTQHFWLQVV